MDYTRLQIEQIPSELGRTVADVRATFSSLDARRLNWRPDSTSWSVAQCFQHLVQSNREMYTALQKGVDPSRSRTFWQRVPFLPAFFGRMLVTTQAPSGKRKFSAPKSARPSTSDIDADVLDRFVAGHEEVASFARGLVGREAGRTIMVSPFVSFVTYSVLDGLRLIVAHERRHVEQARRVMQAPGFPQ